MGWYAKLSEERKDEIKEKNYWRRIEQRKIILAAYGNKCVVCGIDDPRVLNLDHVYGGGSKHRRSVNNNSIYPEVIREGFPAKYQLLYRNHDWLKYIEGKKR